MRVCLVRHAPVLAPSGLCYGRLDLPADPVLTALAARTLATGLPPATVLRTSPAARCVSLAQALADLRPDLQPQLDERLQEMDFGSWEGRTWDAVGREAVDAWTADFATHAPGGGESVTALLARVASAWDDARARGGDQVWITHAGVVRAARLLASGVHVAGRADEWPATPVPHGQAQWLSAAAPAVPG